MRPYTLKSPLETIRAMSPAEREQEITRYRQGFTINAFH